MLFLMLVARSFTHTEKWSESFGTMKIKPQTNKRWKKHPDERKRREWKKKLLISQTKKQKRKRKQMNMWNNWKISTIYFTFAVTIDLLSSSLSIALFFFRFVFLWLARSLSLSNFCFFLILIRLVLWLCAINKSSFAVLYFFLVCLMAFTH